ncbi:unnamed protein product [Lasius platythorax]|uniref:Uncharacterized protein n=1 Tax=Lasius platythorax TaxID=488582 RepID=A0AAV2NN47_9HYME
MNKTIAHETAKQTKRNRDDRRLTALSIFHIAQTCLDLFATLMQTIESETKRPRELSERRDVNMTGRVARQRATDALLLANSPLGLLAAPPLLSHPNSPRTT